MLTAPEVSFQKEIERIKLIGTRFQAKPTRNPADQSLQADLDDLRAALASSGVSTDQITEIVKQHRAERQKIDVKADDSLRPTNSVRLSGELPHIVSGLPPEFADYFRGAIAWHQNQLEAARAAWERVLRIGPPRNESISPPGRPSCWGAVGRRKTPTALSRIPAGAHACERGDAGFTRARDLKPWI